MKKKTNKILFIAAIVAVVLNLALIVAAIAWTLHFKTPKNVETEILPGSDTVAVAIHGAAASMSSLVMVRL